MRPVITVVVHTRMRPGDSGAANVLEQARKLLTKALEPVDETLAGKDYLIGDFSGADIMLGHACFMSNRIGSVSDEMKNLKAYVERITPRPAFQKAITLQ